MSGEQSNTGRFNWWPKSRGARLGRWLLAIALFLLLLPEIIRFALIQWFPTTGIGELSIHDIDLNLFNATAGVEGVTLSRDGQTKLALDSAQIDINWLKLLLGQIWIERAAIDGLRLSAREMPDGNWDVVVPLGAKADAAAPAPESPPAQGELPKILLRELNINHVQVTVDSTVASGVFAIDALQLVGLSSWLSDPAELELAASWQQAPLKLSLSVSPWIDVPSLSGSLQIQGLPLEGIRPVAGGTLAGAVNADLQFSAQKTPERVAAAVEGSYSMADFSAGYKNVAVEHQRLAWAGKVEMAQQLTAERNLTFSVAGDIDSREFSIREREPAIDLLHWQSLTVDGLRVDQANNMSLDRVAFAGIDALDQGDDSERFHTGAFEVNKVQLSAGNRLRIDEVLLSQGRYDVLIDKQGKLQIESLLTQVLAGLEDGQAVQPPVQQQAQTQTQASTKTSTKASTKTEPAQASTGQQPAAPAQGPATAASEPAASSFLFSLNKLQVQGDTRINFTDQRFAVPVKEALVIEDLTVGHIDQIDPDNETTLALKARIGDFSSLTATGTAKLFGGDISASVNGQLKAVELPVLSPYSEAYLGYQLSRGQYDHKFKLSIADNVIDLQNTLHLRQLKVESVDPDKPQPLEKQLDVPLGLALDMLRDGNDNIKLDVPIKGRLDNPDIKITDVINSALGSALKAGATSYLTLALQPYGAILMAADYIGDQMQAVRLEPLLFTPGSDELPEQSGYTDKLLGLLQQRPKLNLTVCGFSNQADSDALLAAAGKPLENPEAALLQLAEQRGKNVKRLFLEKGVESKRVLLCQPKFETKAINGVQLAM